MTFLKGSSFLPMASLMALAVLFALASTSSDAADRDIFGDWVVSGGLTTVSNETIDVRGNVSIKEGGTLRLENCTLVINGSQDGERTLEVNTTGHLEAFDTHIQGSPGRIRVNCYNDTLLQRCTLRHIHGASVGIGVGITLYEGDITIQDSTITDGLWTCMVVFTDLDLLNVTFEDIQYRQVYVVNTLMSGPTTVRVDGCTFDGHNTVSGRTSFAIQVAAYNTYEDITMSVRNSSLEFLNSGIDISCHEELDMTVEDCSFLGCWKGLEIRQTGSTITVRRNVLRQASIVVTGGGALDLRIEDNVIEQAETGMSFGAEWGQSYECSVVNMTIRNCTTAVSAVASAGGGWVDVAVRDSVLESVGTGFVARHNAEISVYDTVHVPGSGRAEGTGSQVRAYTTLVIQEVRWRDGPALEEGSLHLRDRDGVTMTVFDIAELVPREFLGWERSETTSFTHVFLNPAIELDDHIFGGERYYIWDVGPTVVEMIDDAPPEVTIAHPVDGTGVNTSQLKAWGVYTERGSGLVRLERSVDEGPYLAFTSFSDGRWDLTVPDLTDGEHNLSVRGVDAAGGVGNVSFSAFFIDTVPPELDISRPPELVNVDRVVLEGRIEPGSVLTIDGQGVPAQEDGTFTIGVYLDEGPNDLVVTVTDRAENTYSTVLHIVCDTIPPNLELTSPANMTWVNATWTEVEGVVEPGATLTVMDEEVEVRNGAFNARLELTEGEFAIHVAANDPAGNVNSTVVVLFVDWTAPVLTITRPEEDEFYTRDLELWIYGEVDDPLVESVRVNGRVIDLFSGGFSKLCTLLEGPNEFVIEASDPAGNTAVGRVLAHRDLTPPVFNVTLTSEGGALATVEGRLYSTAGRVRVQVTVDSPASIVLQNGTATPLSESHQWTLDLEEGRNVVRFDVVDQAGNEGQTFVQDVFLDTTRPFIVIIEPPPDSTTREGRVLVHGSTEEGSTARVAGTVVEVGTGGEFRVYVDLLPGPNDIEVEVVDVMGNTNATTVRVEREGDGDGQGPTSLVSLVAIVIVIAAVAAGAYVLLDRRRRPPTDATMERDSAPARSTGTSPEGDGPPSSG